MTHRQMLALLLSMQDAQHSSMDEQVHFFDGSDVINVDMYESLGSGQVYLIAAIERVTDAEA